MVTDLFLVVFKTHILLCTIYLTYRSPILFWVFLRHSNLPNLHVTPNLPNLLNLPDPHDQPDLPDLPDLGEIKNQD